MKTRLIRVGNSRGIRIPKPLLEEAGLEDEVELEVGEDGLRIIPCRAPRAGWGEAAASLAATDSGLLDLETSTDFDDAEWEW